MAEQHKRSSLLHDAQQHQTSAKKSRNQAPSPSRVCVVKQEPEREAGDVSPVVGGTGAVAVEEAMDEPQIKLSFAVSLFQCRACVRPLRPPTFKCEVGHLVCGACRGSHGQACDRAVVACPDVDVYVRNARLPCANEEFGCDSLPVYYQAADHERACHWAPCRCPDPACDVSMSPARLLAHFADHHSWPVTGVSYAKPHRIALPPPPRGLHFLVAEEDGHVFLVSSSALGAAVAASLVCVLANGDDAAGAPGRFRCTLWVEDARSCGGDVARVMFKVASSDLSGGHVAAAEQRMFLAVPPELLHDAPGDGEMPDLMVRIDKVDVVPSTSGGAEADTAPADDGLVARRKRVLKPNPRFAGPEWSERRARERREECRTPNPTST